MALTNSKVSNVHRIIGKVARNIGDHMAHAATGVTDGNKQSKVKRQKLRKAFAKYRKHAMVDEGTHHWGADER